MSCLGLFNLKLDPWRAWLAGGVLLVLYPRLTVATDIPASPADRPPLVYPDSARRAEGSVLLRFTIGADGHVQAPQVVRSEPPFVFDEAALQGVSRWIYHPRLHDGQAVAQPGQSVQITFRPPLVPLFQPPLEYPRLAYVAGQEGKVHVGYDISAFGVPTNVHMINATPPGVFDAAAVKNVELWEFSPSVNGQDSSGQTADIVFKLKDAHLTPVPDRPIRLSYPANAQSKGIMGDCNVEYWIEGNGTTSDARIRYCVPAGYFEAATLDAVRLATYKPEADPALNHRRRHYANIAFRFEHLPNSDVHYLKPGQWIRLRYTLTPQGRAKDVEVMAKSDPSILARAALLQLRETQFAPVLENGRPVEKTHLVIAITGN